MVYKQQIERMSSVADVMKAVWYIDVGICVYMGYMVLMHMVMIVSVDKQNKRNKYG